MRMIRGLIGVAVVGTLVGGVVPTAGATNEPGGVIHYYQTTTPTGQATSIVAGAIADYGTTVPVRPGELAKVELKHGTFEVNISAMEQKLSPSISTNCSFTYSATAPAPILDGTGAYAGIRGTMSVTESGAGILSKLKNGKCNETQNSEPIASVNAIEGTATVSF